MKFTFICCLLLPIVLTNSICSSMSSSHILSGSTESGPVTLTGQLCLGYPRSLLGSLLLTILPPSVLSLLTPHLPSTLHVLLGGLLPRHDQTYDSFLESLGSRHVVPVISLMSFVLFVTAQPACNTNRPLSLVHPFLPTAIRQVAGLRRSFLTDAVLWVPGVCKSLSFVYLCF